MTSTSRIDTGASTELEPRGHAEWRADASRARRSLRLVADVAQVGLIGTSPAFVETLHQAKLVAATDATVLLQGETGTGKDLLARAIHGLSPRREQAFVTVNCAALPGELVESDLFGHERGAFTGAATRRRGRFELADGGTLVLDEVGELVSTTQAKLLRVLQSGEFERVGGEPTLRADVRLIAATNRNLEEAVHEGRFRADLYYRLCVFPIRVPPLRERRADIAPLAEHFLGRCAGRLHREFATLTPGSLARLEGHSWPGNVRELENVIVRAAILASGPVIGASDLRLLDLPLLGSEARTMLDVERAHLRRVLSETDGVIEGAHGAAAVLGLHPNTLRSRLKRLGIERPVRRRRGDGR